MSIVPTFQERLRKQTGPAWLLVFASILVAVIQLVVGVNLEGNAGAHDGPFAVSSLVQFRTELLAGDLIPRWAVTGHAGLGSPIFFFYPPGAYYAASLVSFAFPGAAPATVIGMTGVLLRAGAILSCTLWLRSRTTMSAASTGGALYTLMPYIAVLNPQFRLAFAECAASVVLPLFFLAIDQAGGRVLATVVLTAALMGVLAMVHLPTTVLAGGLLILYAAWSGEGWNEVLRRCAAAVVGTLLGLGLAGLAVIPAIGLLPEISASALFGPDKQPENHFLLSLSTFRSLHGLFADVSLIVPVGAALAVLPFTWKSPRQSRPLLWTLIVAVLFTIPLSGPLWKLLIPLRQVQFPSRFLLPASLLAAGFVATVLPRCPRGAYRSVLACGFGAAAAWIGLGIWLGDPAHSGEFRTAVALRDPYANAPEYMPRLPAAQGWLGFGQNGGDFQERASGMISDCVKGQVPYQPGPEKVQLTFNVAHCLGPTILPQFFFPGWSANSGSADLPVAPDPKSGFVSVSIPPGTTTLALRRTMLPVEKLGLLVSALSFGLWICLASAALKFRMAPRNLRPGNQPVG